MVDLTQFKAGIEAAMNETVDHALIRAALS